MKTEKTIMKILWRGEERWVERDPVWNWGWGFVDVDNGATLDISQCMPLSEKKDPRYKNAIALWESYKETCENDPGKVDMQMFGQMREIAEPLIDELSRRDAGSWTDDDYMDLALWGSAHPDFDRFSFTTYMIQRLKLIQARSRERGGR